KRSSSQPPSHGALQGRLRTRHARIWNLGLSAKKAGGGCSQIHDDQQRQDGADNHQQASPLSQDLRLFLVREGQEGLLSSRKERKRRAPCSVWRRSLLDFRARQMRAVVTLAS